MPLTGVKNVILVLSGKGGVGKSSVTLQLALSLCLQGHSVGILDIDLTGPSIPRLVGKERERVRMGGEGWEPVLVHEGGDKLEVRLNEEDDDDAEEEGNREGREGETGENGEKMNGHHGGGGGGGRAGGSTTKKTRRIGSLRTMSLGFILPSRDSAVIWRGPKKTAMIRQFLSDVSWESGPQLQLPRETKTDYLIVDTPPGTGDEHIALAEQVHELTHISTSSTTMPATIPAAGAGSDESSTQNKPRLLGAVVVTTPQAVSTSDVRKELNFCDKTGIPVVGVIENMAGYMCPCCGEVTDVFSKGGGEIMAQEFGVRFLGRVPLDPGWGDTVEGKGRDGENYGETIDGESVDATLVERYAKGRLSAIFEGIAEKVLQSF